MAQLAYHKATPYFSSLTKRYYATYDTEFQDSLRTGGGAEPRSTIVQGFVLRFFLCLRLGDASQ